MKTQGVKIAAVLIAALAWCSTAWPAANYTGAFLEIGPGAEAAAMAESFGALAEGAFGSYYNPAGLGRPEGMVVGIQHNEWGQDMRLEFLTAAVPIGPGRAGIGLTYSSYGVLETRNESGYLTGETFAPFDVGAALSYGMQVMEEGMAGATLEVFHEQIDNYQDIGLAATLGALWTTPWKGITLGSTFKHLGASLDGYMLPMQAVAAAAYAWSAGDHAAKANLDVELPLSSGDVELALGAEYAFMQMVALRLGYRVSPGEGESSLSGLSAGVGVQWQGLDVGYAIRPVGDLGLAHRVSLDYYFPANLFSAPAGAESADEKAQRYFERGKVLEAKQEWVDALVEYRMALWLNSQLAEAQSAAQRLETQLKSITTTQPTPDSTAPAEPEVNPQVRDAILKHYQLGQEYMQKRAYKKAMNEFELILEFYPRHPQAQQQLAKTKTLLRAETERLHTLALQARERNDTAQEMEYWRQALEADKDDAVAMDNLWLGIISTPMPVDEKTREQKKEQLKF